MRMEDFMIIKLFHGGSGGFNGYGTPVGTAIGAMSRPSTMGLLVVRPSGIKLCPPNIPMSLRDPSRSLYCGSGQSG